MRIGVPRERKAREGRVSLIPAACRQLVSAGHELLVESGAGLGSGFSDDDYRAAGADVLPGAAEVYEGASLIVKVKEPIEADLALLREHHLLFSYLHLAAEPALTRRLLDIGLTAIGFETVQEADGSLPLLAPMSDIAGRLSIQIGTGLLHATGGGKGLLLGGLPGTPRGRVVIIGAGNAGGNAARLAAAAGAEVVVFDRARRPLEAMRALGPNVTALFPFEDAIASAVAAADLLVGAILVPGRRATHVVLADMVRAMQTGSVVMDISVDQGGCIETTRPTSYDEPTFDWEGVVHFGVTNMPGSVPRTAVQALSAALAPWVPLLAGKDWREHPSLAAAVNVESGRLVHPALVSEFGDMRAGG